MREDNYIQIFCTTVARLLEADTIDLDDMKLLIIQFSKVAADIHSRQDLITFIQKFPGYPQFQPLVRQLEDSRHEFIFNDIPEDIT